jgi:hypothetical protein
VLYHILDYYRSFSSKELGESGRPVKSLNIFAGSLILTPEQSQIIEQGNWRYQKIPY